MVTRKAESPVSYDQGAFLRLRNRLRAGYRIRIALVDGCWRVYCGPGFPIRNYHVSLWRRAVLETLRALEDVRRVC